jgi:uncharacterized membrane protein
MPELPTLRKYVRLDAHLISLSVPAWHWIWRGLLLLLFVTPVCAFIGIAAAFALEPDEAPVLVVLMGILGGFSLMSGFALLVLAPILSKRTRVSVDLANGFVTTAREPYPIAVATLSGIRISQPNPLSAFRFLEATRNGAGPVVLLGPIVAKHVTDATALATWLGTTFRVPVDPALVTGATAVSNPDADRFPAMLCYFPIQGIFIIASLYFLATAGKRRPFVRFCAIQSLSQVAFSIVVLAVILVVLGVRVALLPDSPLQIPLVVVLALALTGFWFWNFGAQAYACYSAYKGRAWVMPWLGFWSRRFLPMP